MNKQDILNYLRNTPENTNVNIVGNMLDELIEESGGGGAEESDYIRDKIIITKNDLVWDEENNVYVLNNEQIAEQMHGWFTTYLDAIQVKNLLSGLGATNPVESIDPPLILQGWIKYNNGVKEHIGIHIERDNMDQSLVYLTGQSFTQSETSDPEKFGIAITINQNTGTGEYIVTNTDFAVLQSEEPVEEIDLYLPYYGLSISYNE